MCIIYWKNLKTGIINCGDPVDCQTAMEAVSSLINIPDMLYWVSHVFYV